jgi:uncharacterized protein (TIGR03032 family)
MSMVAERPGSEAHASSVGGAPFRDPADDGLAELLHDLNVTLLATTYQSGRLIAVRAPDRSALDTQWRAFRRPMGLAADADRLALGTQMEVWDFRNQAELAGGLEPAGMHDACYLPRNIHVTGDIAIHEIAFAGGELWGVNTRFSALCTFDADHSFVPRWRPPFLAGTAADDQCHMNGMAVVDGRVRYVSAFGATSAPRGWREGKSRGGVLVDVDSGETVLRGLSMPHSPRSHQGDFWILESGRGTLALADLRTGRVETALELPGFTRGLAFAGPYAFIGLSMIRERNLFTGMPLLERVPERECGIWVVDLRRPAVVATLRFAAAVTEIFDVQVLHGTRCPEIMSLGPGPVATSFVVPENAYAALQNFTL